MSQVASPGAGPEVPFPLVLKDGQETGIVVVPVKGNYSAEEIGGVVTVRATGIAMSGLNARAALVFKTTLRPPERFDLIGYSTMRNFANILWISADPVHFKANTDNDKEVIVLDSDGEHTIEIKHL